MNDIFFSADLHLGHSRIIQYCNRPFSGHEEMGEAILDRFNSVIKRGDMLYIIGDVAWSTYNQREFFDRLNTRAVHLILGNHDKHKPSEYAAHFQWVGDYKKITVNKVPVVLFHYPIRSWNGKGQGGYHLYGHCHNTLPGIGRSMDVGVDTNGFYPYSWEDVDKRLRDIPIFKDDPADSHNKNG